MVSEFLHNVGIVIDPKGKKPVVVFLVQNFGGGAEKRHLSYVTFVTNCISELTQDKHLESHLDICDMP